MSHGVKLYSNATVFAFVNLGKKIENGQINRWLGSGQYLFTES